MIRTLHEQLRTGAKRAEELVRASIEDIARRDQSGDLPLGAFLHVMEERALAAARQVDEDLAAGREIDILAGIPYGVKDAICIKDTPTTAASKILENYIAPYNATVIERLNALAAIPLGKTNMDEFAMGASTENSAYGITRNPHASDRVPGGSSGGSAAAVGAGLVPWALGSDTGGSIRQPAAFCGCVGLKPTYGRVSRYGLIAMASSLDQIGPITQTVEDAAIVLSRIAGHDSHDATSAQSSGKRYEQYLTGDVSGVTIGVLPPETYAMMDKRIAQRIEHVADTLAKNGATIVPISLPHLTHALSAYYIIMPSEVSSNMARFDGIRYGRSASASGDIHAQYGATRAEFLGREVKRRIMLGTYALSAGYYDQYYAKAQKVRRLIHQDFVSAFEHVQCILMPTTPETAFRIGSKTDDPLTMYLSDIFTVSINLAGVPAISVPVGTVTEEDGATLPIGAQIVGKWFDEEGMLAVADVVERVMRDV